MIILHASISEGRFLIWGETPVPADLASDDSNLLPFKAKKVLPYDAGHAALVSALAELQIPEPAQAAMSEAQIGIPSFKGVPLASSGLIDASAEHEMGSKIATWSLSVVELKLSQALPFLMSLAQQRVPVPGIVVGQDVSFWSALLSFVAGLVMRQRFLPGVKQRDGQWHAVWEPVIAGDDLERFTTLVATAPDVVRAVSVPSVRTKALRANALYAVHHFVSLFLDYIVRSSNDSGANKLAATDFGLTGVHDSWLHALTSSDSKIVASSEKLKELQADLARWKKPINTTLNAPFRLCFRLQEPKSDDDLRFGVTPDDQFADFHVSDDAWKITYLLQSTTDPSLVIDATSIWSGARQPAFIERTKFSAREYLLASLGAASMLYPAVEKSLLNAAPSAVELDVRDAYSFLTEYASLLQQAGFGVMMPSWWSGRKKRVKTKATAKTFNASEGKLKLDSLVKFEWEVALGDHKLSRSELEQLAAMKIPLVRLRGEWVELQPDELNAAIGFLKTKKYTATVSNVIKLLLGAEKLPGNLTLDGIESSGELGAFLDQIQGQKQFEEIEPDSHFQGELRPYQKRGYSWLNFLGSWGLGTCLADDMGLGKTVQTLALLQRQWNEEPQTKPTLLVCPMSVVGNWQREAERFTPDLPVMIHHGASRVKGADFAKQANAHALVLTSYSLLARDIKFLQQIEWSNVVLDEAQNIKNSRTKLAKAARELTTNNRIALTGTPVENNVGDLWSIMDFLNPGLLGNSDEFKHNFLMPIQFEKDKEVMDRLKRITGPFILRRLKTDKEIIKDLPEKQEMKVFCNLTREQASLYEAVVKELDDQMKAGGIEPGMVLSTLSKLKQVCNHPAQLLHDKSVIAGRSGKVMRLTEMLEEALQVDDRVLVFSQYAEMGEMLKQHLQDTFGQEVLFLHGGVNKERREKMVHRFQNEVEGPQIFILSLKAGGVGLNLTRANQVFHFDRWWNPAVENQATDRAFRIGQKRNVQVHKFVCVGTLEEKIDRIIETKQELAANLVGTGESWLADLSDGQLRDLFALGEDAVGD